MENIVIYFLLTIILVCIILIIYTIMYNHFQEYIIRINEVEAEIDNTLRSKFDLINKYISLVKKDDANENEKELFDSFIKLRHLKLSNFDLDRKLIEINHKLLEISPQEEDIEEGKKIQKSISSKDNSLEALKTYYNNNISKYNKLVRIFPTNIVSGICHYKEKLYFDRKNMNDEDYEDFKL